MVSRLIGWRGQCNLGASSIKETKGKQERKRVVYAPRTLSMTRWNTVMPSTVAESRFLGERKKENTKIPGYSTIVLLVPRRYY